MDSNRFVTCINRLHVFQGVFITFNKDGISALRRIKGLSHPNRTAIFHGDLLTVETVLESGDWEQDKNRTILVDGMLHIDSDTLADIAKDIEKIDAGKSFASGLITNRKKRQKEVAQQLILDVLNEDILSKVSSWNASIEGNLVEFDGLPAIEFTIKNTATQNTIVRIAIDSWSGRHRIDGTGEQSVDEKWRDQHFENAHDVRESICSAFTWALEKATAA
jgi:hypothetical protein